VIKINERFSTERYQFGWRLYDTTPTEPKGDKPPKKEFSVNITYYPSLDFVCKAVLDKSLVNIPDLERMRGLILEVSKDIETAVAEAKI